MLVTAYSDTSPAYEKVLATFSQPHLQKLLSKLQAEVKKLEADRALIQRYSGTPHKQIYMILEGLDKSSIFSPAFVSAFPSFWDAITVQEHKSNNHQLNLLLMRSQIMAAVGSAWTWLDVQFPAMCMAILRDEGECVCATSAGITLTIYTVDKQSAPWLYRLVQDVKKARCHCGVVQLDPLSYDLRVPSTAARTFDFSDQDLEPSSEVLDSCVLAVLHSTIHSWLAFPGPQSVSRIQGTFIRHLTSVFGSGQVLLLEKVWGHYRFARNSLLGDRLPPRQAFQPDMLSEFLQDLSALPLADSDSEERRILSQIEDAVTAHRALLSGAAVPAPAPSPLSLPSSSTPSGLHPPPTSSMSLIIPSVPDAVIKAAAGKLTAFMLELLPLLDTAGPPASPNAVQQWALDDLDYRLPFRQHAPETISARAPDSFAHPAIIHSPGALASLWFARGVTYRAPFSRDYRAGRLFPDFAAWEAKCAAVVAEKGLVDGEDSKYFCNITAYGAPSHDRKEENFKVYFEKEAEWRVHFPKGQPVPYVTAQTWMCKHLPGVGKLTSALCASDLVYSGLVEMPSVEEMGNLVCRIGAGAVKGLVALRLVQGQGPSSKVFPIFCRLYRALDSSLDAELKAKMDFDVIMFEHLLCKYHRVQKL